MSNSLKWHRKTGATLLEILVVLTIIMLIAAVVGPRVVGYLGRAKSDTVTLQIQQIDSAVKLFYIDTGRFPTEAEGLAVLFSSPGGEAGWNGPYLESETALTDPWGRAYLYQAPDEGGDFAITSLGRDGRRGGSGEDADIIN